MKAVVSACATSHLGSVVEELWAILLGPVYQTIREHVGELGLTRSQGRLLYLLGFGESVSQVQIARILDCDPSNVSTLADLLEARGLIERRVDPLDRRVRVLALTSDGQAVRGRLSASLAQAERSIARLDASEQSILRDLLLKAFGSQTLIGGDA